MKECLEADHANRHKEETRKTRERMEADNKKRMREAVKQSR